MIETTPDGGWRFLHPEVDIRIIRCTPCEPDDCKTSVGRMLPPTRWRGERDELRPGRLDASNQATAPARNMTFSGTSVRRAFPRERGLRAPRQIRSKSSELMPAAWPPGAEDWSPSIRVSEFASRHQNPPAEVATKIAAAYAPSFNTRWNRRVLVLKQLRLGRADVR